MECTDLSPYSHWFVDLILALIAFLVVQGVIYISYYAITDLYEDASARWRAHKRSK